MIFGLSFSACADAVTTGGVTAVVTPRPVDSLGNEKQVEFATSAKSRNYNNGNHHKACIQPRRNEKRS